MSRAAQPGLTESDPARRLSTINIVAGIVLASALYGAFRLFGSQLALAQAADSFVDTLTAAALWWAVRISRAPPDDDHPVGHHAAEPLGALLVAVAAGALSVEVGTQAAAAIFAGTRPDLDFALVVVFSTKVIIKLFIVRSAVRADRRRIQSGAGLSPALRAIAVDSRNDVLVGVVALIGFVAARYGTPAVDAWLAVPLAAWIGVSAVFLGLENVQLLMGEAANPERRAALQAVAGRVAGVKTAHSLRAHHRGNGLLVWVQVAVDPALTVRQGHDIGEAVEAALKRERDVIDAFAHVDVE